MTDKNKHLVFKEKYSCELVESYLPELQDGQILVRNSYSLISPGTELAMYTGSHSGIDDVTNCFAKYPFYPGYSALGEIVDSRGAEETYRVGDFVWSAGPHAAFQPFNPKEQAVCKVNGHGDNHGPLFSQFYSISNTAFLIRHINPSSLVVIGSGLIGNFAAQIFKLKLGCKTVVLDTQEGRLERARQCGIEYVIQSDGSEVSTALQKFLPNGKADVVIEATGNPLMLEASLNMVRPGGEVILLGSTRGQVKFDAYRLLHRSNILLTGAHTNAYGLGLCSQSGKTYTVMQSIQEGMELLSNGSIFYRPLISDLVKPTHAKQAYDQLLKPQSNALGVIIDWN